MAHIRGERVGEGGGGGWEGMMGVGGWVVGGGGGGWEAKGGPRLSLRHRQQ